MESENRRRGICHSGRGSDEVIVASSIRQLNGGLVTLSEGDSAQAEAWSDVLKRYSVDEVVAVTTWDQSAI
jgi:hypothetical protein